MLSRARGSTYNRVGVVFVKRVDAIAHVCTSLNAITEFLFSTVSAAAGYMQNLSPSSGLRSSSMRHNRFRNPMLDPPSEPLPKPQRPPPNLLSLHDQELLARRAMQKRQDDTVIFDQLFSSDTATGAVKRVRHAQFVRLDKKKEDEARRAHQQRQQAQVRASIDASVGVANSLPAPSRSNSRNFY